MDDHNYQENIAKSYRLILNCNDCIPLITTPTKVTHQSQTLIDHILTRNLS